MDQAMPNPCEHWYASHVRGGQPVSVRICRLCDQVDWDDLREQVDALLLQRQYEVAEAFRGPRYTPSPREEAAIREEFARQGIEYPPVPAIPADPKGRP